MRRAKPIILPVATLYMVATPIGNLGDISARALQVLGEVDCIACEDTRHSLKLLSHYGIRKPLLACHANREEEGARRILERLDAGQDVAYVSDAGTPGLSDPGGVLADLAISAGHKLCPIPGPSAFAAIISVAGLGGRAFLFEGFLSPKPGKRRRRLEELLAREESFVVYESPFRALKFLSDVADLSPERTLVVGRELTKIHEEIVNGTAAAVRDEFASSAKIQGEFVIAVSGKKSAQGIE